MLQIQQNVDFFFQINGLNKQKFVLFFNYFYILVSFITPARTPRISGLRSQVLKPTFLSEAPSELLLPSAKKYAQKGSIGQAGNSRYL